MTKELGIVQRIEILGSTESKLQTHEETVTVDPFSWCDLDTIRLHLVEWLEKNEKILSTNSAKQFRFAIRTFKTTNRCEGRCAKIALHRVQGSNSTQTIGGLVKCAIFCASRGDLSVGSNRSRCHPYNTILFLPLNADIASRSRCKRVFSSSIVNEIQTVNWNRAKVVVKDHNNPARTRSQSSRALESVRRERRNTFWAFWRRFSAACSLCGLQYCWDGFNTEFKFVLNLAVVCRQKTPEAFVVPNELVRQPTQGGRCIFWRMWKLRIENTTITNCSVPNARFLSCQHFLLFLDTYYHDTQLIIGWLTFLYLSKSECSQCQPKLEIR